MLPRDFSVAEGGSAHSRPPGEAAAGEWAAWVAGVAEAAYAEVPHVSDQAAGPGGRESVTTDEVIFWQGCVGKGEPVQ